MIDLFLAIAFLTTILSIFFLISFFLSAHTEDNIGHDVVAPWEDEPVDHETSDYNR